MNAQRSENSNETGDPSISGGLVFGALFVAIIAVLVYVLIVLWPEGGTVGGGRFDLFWGGWILHLTADQQLLVLVVLSGAIGGFVNSLQHLSKYVGDGNLKWRYGLSYAVQPVAGAAIALILYVVIRAGFVNFDQVKDLNIYGYLGLSLLSGLFADQAMGKLRAVAGALFTDPSPRVNPPGGGGSGGGGAGAGAAVDVPPSGPKTGPDVVQPPQPDERVVETADTLVTQITDAQKAAEEHARVVKKQAWLKVEASKHRVRFREDPAQ